MKYILVIIALLLPVCLMADMKTDAANCLVSIKIVNDAGKSAEVSGFFAGSDGCLITSDSCWFDFGSDNSVSFTDMKITAEGKNCPKKQIETYYYSDKGHTILKADPYESGLVFADKVPSEGDTLNIYGYGKEQVQLKVAAVDEETVILEGSLDKIFEGGIAFDKNGKVAGYVYESGQNPTVNAIDSKDINAGIAECMENLRPRDEAIWEPEEGVLDDEEEWDEELNFVENTEKDEVTPPDLNYGEAAVEITGNRVILGTFNDEPIEWMVLRKEDGEALLLSVKALDYDRFHQYSETIAQLKQFKLEHKQYPPVTWEESSLRAWLNGEFFNEAFSPSEKGFLTETHNDDTDDMVFLLSVNEAKQYFKRYDARMCYPTAYAQKRGAKNKALRWWLRSEGMSDMRAAVVTADGRVEPKAMEKENTATALAGVRPAIVVRCKQ